MKFFNHCLAKKIGFGKGRVSTSVTAPTTSPTAAVSSSPLSTPVLSRRLAYIMFVRVILFTLILGGTVALNVAWGTPEELGSTYVTFLFVFIASIYVLNIFYAILQRFIRNLPVLAMFQVGGDLLISAVLIHFTGGLDSAFILFFLLSPIAAAVTLHRRAALFTALAGSLVLALLFFLEHAHWLPLLPGQIPMSYSVNPGHFGRSLLINSAAMFAVAVLAGYLAEQLRSVSEKIEAQQTFINDLAALNADIIRCLTSGLITLDTEGRILTLNLAAAEILALPYFHSAGKMLIDLVPELAQVIAKAEEIRRAEVTLKRNQTLVRLGISVSRLADHRNETQGRIINFQDLTTYRQMEEKIQRSEHLASLGRMAAGIAHEICNPLASISGSFIPRVVRAGVPMRMPLGVSGGF